MRTRDWIADRILQPLTAFAMEPFDGHAAISQRPSRDLSTA